MPSLLYIISLPVPKTFACDFILTFVPHGVDHIHSSCCKMGNIQICLKSVLGWTPLCAGLFHNLAETELQIVRNSKSDWCWCVCQNLILVKYGPCHRNRGALRETQTRWLTSAVEQIMKGQTEFNQTQYFKLIFNTHYLTAMTMFI